MTFPVAVHKISEDGKKFVSKDFAKLKDINIEIAHTITATNAGGGCANHNAMMAMEITEENKMNKDISCKVIGKIPNNKSIDIANRVYSKSGLSPCITAHGNDTTPKIIDTEDNLQKEFCIVASRGRNPTNPSSKEKGIKTQQKLEVNKNETTNTLTTVQKDNYVLERAIESIRIRKLTPLECFRLMGVTDEDANKMLSVNSNSQCYKQAGNSIVVDVMCAIFENLNLKKVKEEK